MDDQTISTSVTITTAHSYFVEYHHEPQNKWEPLYLATDDFSRQRQGREAVNCLMADGSDLPVLRARGQFVGKRYDYDRNDPPSGHLQMTAASPVRLRAVIVGFGQQAGHICYWQKRTSSCFGCGS
eukprot:scaffold586_cov112-Skeletonema_dohrnii-CCMP3373.AAC.15